MISLFHPTSSHHQTHRVASPLLTHLNPCRPLRHQGAHRCQPLQLSPHPAAQGTPFMAIILHMPPDSLSHETR